MGVVVRLLHWRLQGGRCSSLSTGRSTGCRVPMMSTAAAALFGSATWQSGGCCFINRVGCVPTAGGEK